MPFATSNLAEKNLILQITSATQNCFLNFTVYGIDVSETCIMFETESYLTGFPLMLCTVWTSNLYV